MPQLPGELPTANVHGISLGDASVKLNQAIAAGRESALLYRNWLVDSDAALDPQATILTPQSAIAIAKAIVAEPTPLRAGIAAALTAVQILSDAHRAGRLRIAERELPWLYRIREAVEEIPATESEFIASIMGQLDATKFVAADYGL